MGERFLHEEHRAATPLELLYDLMFVVAFGAAGNEAAHFVAEGHWRTALIGFGFGMLAVIWAWIQNTWFASAYDTDDWIYRLLTFVQMIGVLVLALGLPPMFESIDHGDTLDNDVVVAGYVLMRIALVFLWTQVARQDTAHSRAAWAYVITIGIAQAGWVTLAAVDLPVGTSLLLCIPLLALEIAGPGARILAPPVYWIGLHDHPYSDIYVYERVERQYGMTPAQYLDEIRPDLVITDAKIATERRVERLLYNELDARAKYELIVRHKNFGDVAVYRLTWPEKAR